MKKTFYIFLLVLMGMNLTAQSVWDGKREAIINGSGTENDPYLIENAQNLAWLIYTINWDYASWTEGKYFLLTTDIDLNGNADNQWIPIGAGVSNSGKKAFNGVFDGGFHKITGLYIDDNNEINKPESLWKQSNAAFFSQLDNNTQVKNLYIEGYIVNTKTAAGFSGKSGNFEYCISNVDVESVSNNVGGIASTGSITVKNCANIGDIKGNNGVGGIAGFNGNIENCYNTGRVEGADFVGGIAGKATSITNGYNVGDVVADGANKGGIAGKVNTNVNCYYLESCIAESNNYGEPMTAEFMRSQEFVNLLNNDTNVWIADSENTNDGYPVFGDSHFDVFENFVNNTDLVVLYPNPTTDHIHIIGDVVSYEIYDLVGKCVCKNIRLNVLSTIEEIHVSDLQSGIYMIRLFVHDGNVVTKKFIKQ
jgi:hypothetical protein